MTKSDTARQCAIEAAQTRVDDGQFARDLAALVACPSESQVPEGAPHLRAYLEDLMVPRFAASGFATEIHDGTDMPPVLVARRIEDPAKPTVLVYGHGDVVHGQGDAWSDGLSPFELTQRGDRLYGRGSADNKVQHLINLSAAEAVIAARGRLGFNLTFLIEMGEETGSPGLDAFCAAHREGLAADVLIASDGPRLRPEVPTIFLGARGAVNFDLVVDLRDGAHHSGNWGGLLADPAILLTHAIASITDARGAIRVPEWRPNSLTDDVRAMLARLPDPGQGGPGISPDWGEPGLSPAERAYGWNSFAVLAMTSGRPDAPMNAISGTARATCQLRHVVGTDANDILPALRRHLEREGFGMVEVRAWEKGTFPATRTDPDGAWAKTVAASIAQTTGALPDILPNLAGSLPNHVFSETLGLPTIWVPHSYGGCNQHAPDEHVLVPLCRDALGVMTGLYWDIGA